MSTSNVVIVSGGTPGTRLSSAWWCPGRTGYVRMTGAEQWFGGHQSVGRENISAGRVPRTLKEARCGSYWMRCCARDGGRSSGVALQGEASNHRRLRRLSAVRGERCGERRGSDRDGIAQQRRPQLPRDGYLDGIPDGSLHLAGQPRRRDLLQLAADRRG